jgi:predicted PurR-regulated permease PerM
VEGWVSPTWNGAQKRWIITAVAVLTLGFLYFVRGLIPTVVLAVILAFLLNPIVGFLRERFGLRRPLASAVVYLCLVGLIILPFFFVPNLVGRLAGAVPDPTAFQGLLQAIIDRVSTIEAFGIGSNLASALREPFNRFEELFRSAGTASLNVLGRFTGMLASRLIDLIFIIVASLYIVIDTPRILGYLGSLVPPGYERDARYLSDEIYTVWAGFFRGQVILCLSIGIVTGTVMALLGVPYAFWLGVIAGILELVPNIGPILASVPSIALAFFQGSVRFDIDHLWFAVMVAVANILIQQVENHVFVPRIIGGSVNLHPVVTLIGVLVGASLVGILGIFLAAPTIATIRVLAGYIHAKLQDRDPFPVEVEALTDRLPDSPLALPEPPMPEEVRPTPPTTTPLPEGRRRTSAPSQRPG